MSKTFITTLNNPAQSVMYTDSSGQTVTTGRSMEVRVITPDAPGEYPVVFYSHGHLANPAGTGSVNAKALADFGYIVILPTHLDSASNPAEIRNAYPFENPASTLHRIADIKYAFDQLPALMAAAAGYTANTAVPVVAGHSHGARTAGLLTGVSTPEEAYTDLPPGNPFGLTSLVDPRFKASVLLSPPNRAPESVDGPSHNDFSWANYVMPSLSITGTLDALGDITDYSTRLDGFDLSPAESKHALVLRDADHFDIGGFSATAAQTDAIASAMDAFLDAYVKGEANRLLDPAQILGSNSTFSEAYVRAAGASNGSMAGGSGGDRLNGHVTNDSVAAAAGSDTVAGNAGNDSLDGGAGSDALNGGGGRDVATFALASTAATFARSVAWSWNVTNAGETDNLFGVEVAQFTDRKVALREAGRSDVSGDGTSDLVWYNKAAGLISMYELNPAGGYTWKNIGSVGPGYDAFTGDFNGDGEADVLFFNGTSLSYYDVQPGGGYVWKNIGGVSPGFTPIVGDYDGDGTSDIAFWNQSTGALSWYDVNPAGGYTWKNIGSVGPGYTPLTGDFNGDGETDIAWFNGTSLSYYDITNTGGYVWNNIGSVGPGHTALAGDFNNDGTTDVAFINQTTNQISFYAVNPNGGYQWYNIGFVAPGYTPTAADANGDGKTDIVFTGFGSISYYDIGPTGGYTWNNIGGVGAGYAIVG
jgi:hypothetical protein